MTSANAIREIRNKICFLEFLTESRGAAECAFKRPRDKPETKIRLKTTEAARTTHNHQSGSSDDNKPNGLVWKSLMD
jgi:hypothetical protein